MGVGATKTKAVTKGGREYVRTRLAARSKLTTRGSDIRRIAANILWSIHKEGTEAHPYLVPVWEAQRARLLEDVNKRLERLVP